MAETQDFAAWAASKAELERTQREAAAEALESAAAAKAARQATADAAFARWVVDKSTHDDALALLPLLASHGRDDESWRAMGLAYAYTDGYLRDKHTQFAVDVSVNPKRSFENTFLAWTRKNHGFDEVTISAAVAARFSAKARESLEPVGDAFKISGLSFQLFAKGRDYANIKPPSADDKLKNAIFTSAAKKAWKGFVDEAKAALDAEFGPSKTDAKRLLAAKKRGIEFMRDTLDAAREAALKKERDDEASRRATGRAGHLRWLENKNKSRILLPLPDRDAPMPDMFPNPFKGGGRMVAAAPPSGHSFRKIPPTRPPPLPTSVDIALGMEAGLRYAHATGEGASRDLLASRAQLLKSGVVLLQNFASPEDGTVGEEAKAAFAKEKASNAFLLAKTVGVEERKKKEAVAYAAWCVTKDARDLALECMALLPCTLAFEAPAHDARVAPAGVPLPVSADTSAPHDAPRAPGAPAPGEARSRDPTVAPLLARTPTDDERALWRAVGYSCRAIDRTLLPDWIAWSEPLWSKAACWAEWSAFEPPAGAVVSAAARDKREVAGGEMAGANASWGNEPREGALKLLKTLTEEHRRLAEFRETAAAELPPNIPTFRRVPAAEALPTFLHGAEGALHRVAADLAVKDGNGLPCLAGAGVGAELVLQWWVGEEEPGPPPPASLVPGAAPEPQEALLARLAAAAKAARARRETTLDQPPYVIVVECAGVAGGPRSRDGDWSRVVVDPPEPLPLLTSAPGSSFVPLGVHAQGLRVLPPRAGEDWAPRAATRLRGAVRLAGLLPNTTYAFRIRAFSRAGAGPYAFAAFCTAPAPPPAPLPTLKALAPRRLFPSAGVADLAGAAFPFQPDGVTVVWERRIDFRAGFLRLMRTFWTVASATGALAAAAAPRSRPATARSAATPRVDDDGIVDYGDDGVEDDFTRAGVATAAAAGAGGASAGLFAAAVPRAALLAAVAREVGLRNWLASCLAAADVWPMRAGAGAPGATLADAVRAAESDAASTASASMRAASPKALIALARPVSVLEALVLCPAAAITWADACALFSADAEAESAEAILLADVDAPPARPPRDDTLPRKADMSLTAASSKGDVMLALTGRSAGGATSRPSSAGSALSAARATSASRVPFNPIGGPNSDHSIRNAALRASATVLSRAVLKGTHTGGLAGGAALLGATGPAPSPMAARPASAAPGAGRPGSARSAAAFTDGGLGASVLARAPVAPALAPPAGAAALKTTYALFECVSDGPLGQEWSEVYVGVRALRVLDKLLPGTTYALKAQAINGDGQASLFGPQAYVTTALPAPTGLRATAPPTATSVALAWAPVSSANALSTARIMGQAAAPPPPAGGAATAADAPPAKDVTAGADIDAILDALLAKTKGTGATTVAAKPDEDKKKVEPKKVTVPVREGDGGFGVDLRRPWARYDTEKTGFLPVAALRGLLADLGAYAETSLLVYGAADPNAGVVSSGEGAAGVGALEWRFAAAVAKLDPAHTGRVAYADFADWWNAVDAALAKARAVNSVPGTPARGTTSRAQSAGSARPGAAASTIIGAAFGVDGDEEELGAAVVYVVEVRRAVPAAEVSDAAAAVLAAGAGGAPPARAASAASRRPASARSVLATTVGATLTAAAPAAAAAEAAALVGAASMTPWAVVYMGAQTAYKLDGLLPNGHYHVRVSAIGRHAFSSPCRALSVHMPPLAPFAPVAVRVGARSAALRWYPGELGADKFEVQVKIVEALLPLATAPDAAATLGRRVNDGTVFEGRNALETARRAALTARAAQAAGAPPPTPRGEADAHTHWEEDATMRGTGVNEHAWATVFTGVSTYASITGLFANTVYRVRVVAFSSAGAASRPSHELQLVTRDNGADVRRTAAGVVEDFTVECRPPGDAGGSPRGDLDASVASAATPATPRDAALAALQDVVVGDTILFTEDVFMDGSREVDIYNSTAPREVPEDRPNSRFLCSRTVAAVVIGDSASALVAGTGASAALGAPGGPVYVGKQAAALRAMNRAADASAAAAAPVGAHGGAYARAAAPPAGNAEDAVRGRTLQLSVEWSVLSLAPPKERAGLIPGKVIPPRAGAAAAERAAFAPAQYTLPMGAVIERKAADLAKLDVFRTQWFEETKGAGGRWSFAEEIAASYDR